MSHYKDQGKKCCVSTNPTDPKDLGHFPYQIDHRKGMSQARGITTLGRPRQNFKSSYAFTAFMHVVTGF